MSTPRSRGQGARCTKGDVQRLKQVPFKKRSVANLIFCRLHFCLCSSHVSKRCVVFSQGASSAPVPAAVSVASHQFNTAPSHNAPTTRCVMVPLCALSLPVCCYACSPLPIFSFFYSPSLSLSAADEDAISSSGLAECQHGACALALAEEKSRRGCVQEI